MKQWNKSAMRMRILIYRLAAKVQIRLHPHSSLLSNTKFTILKMMVQSTNKTKPKWKAVHARSKSDMDWPKFVKKITFPAVYISCSLLTIHSKCLTRFVLSSLTPSDTYMYSQGPKVMTRN